MSVSKDEKTGKWTVQCYYENWKGEKKHKKRGFTTKREAQKWERDFLKSTSANIFQMIRSKVFISDWGRFFDTIATFIQTIAGGLYWQERTWHRLVMEYLIQSLELYTG